MLQLVAFEDQSLLMNWNSFLSLDLTFEGVNIGVVQEAMQGDRFATERIDKDLLHHSQNNLAPWFDVGI